MDLKTCVGIRIRAARRQSHLSQEQLAIAINRNIETISSIERGKSLPNFETLDRLAKVLKMSVRDFFDFEDEDHATVRRSTLLAEINAMLRTLPDHDLQVALEVVKAFISR